MTTPSSVVSEMMSGSNITTIVSLIVERANPLRDIKAHESIDTIRAEVTRFLTSWKNIGKFDKNQELKLLSQRDIVDHYNYEFVRVFGDKILSPSKTQVASILNPNGLYAQQSRIIKTASRGIPFYERALYKRLGDTNLTQRMDETETPFYKMDHNPRLSDADRKKRKTSDVALPTYYDRMAPMYRNIPQKRS